MNAPAMPQLERKVQELHVKVYGSRLDMGQGAAADIAAAMKSALAGKAEIRMIFASAPSQNEMLDELVRMPGIDWERVVAFHMDEYIGLAADAPQRFSAFLVDKLLGSVKLKAFHPIDSSSSLEEECRRYGELLNAAPIDIVCLGIGENGHIAFNDPPVADFADPETIKPVELDDACRQQQVNDGCFPSFAAVPSHALTLTIPALMSGRKLFCCVPGPTKRAAVAATLNGPVDRSCPASILRTHPGCTLYVDTDSYGGDRP